MYTTRTTILQKLNDNDDIGWQEFYDCYCNLIRCTALKSGVPSADIDDIIQDVMLGIFNNGIFNYSKEKHGLFRTYIGGIIRHKVCDYFRKNHPVPCNFYQEETISGEFEIAFDEEYRKHLISLAVEELRKRVSPEIFETFELCCCRNLPVKDAAYLLEAKPNTITIRKKRCLDILNSIITQLNNADPNLKLSIL